MSSASLIHVADPMCSWCYAFAPELDRILNATGLDVRLVMGGLYVSDRVVPLDDTMRSYLHQTWARVSAASGQRVGYDVLAWSDWIYDTEPACRAVVAVRELSPTRALDYFDAVQRGFYEHNLDTTKSSVLEQIAGEIGIAGPDVVGLTADGSMVDQDFAEATALGAQGFPHVILDTGTERIPVSVGYQRAAPVIRTIRALVGLG